MELIILYNSFEYPCLFKILDSELFWNRYGTLESWKFDIGDYTEEIFPINFSSNISSFYKLENIETIHCVHK